MPTPAADAARVVDGEAVRTVVVDPTDDALPHALAADHDTVAARLSHGTSLALRGQFGAALAELDAALALAPHAADARARRATVRGRIGDFGGALDDLDRAEASLDGAGDDDDEDGGDDADDAPRPALVETRARQHGMTVTRW